MDNKPIRKSPRLQGNDYRANGAYFVTICTAKRQHLFGTIENGQMTKSKLGEVVESEFANVPRHYTTVDVDLYVVMPNHFHGIFLLFDSTTQNRAVLGNVVRAFKAGVTRTIRRKRLAQIEQVTWQMGFHDRIVRNETELNMFRQYMLSNPEAWSEDRFSKAYEKDEAW